MRYKTIPRLDVVQPDKVRHGPGEQVFNLLPPAPTSSSSACSLPLALALSLSLSLSRSLSLSLSLFLLHKAGGRRPVSPLRRSPVDPGSLKPIGGEVFLKIGEKHLPPLLLTENTLPQKQRRISSCILFMCIPHPPIPPNINVDMFTGVGSKRKKLLPQNARPVARHQH